MDIRLKHTSYSSMLTLHECPRKYELYKKNSQISYEEAEEESLTFLYGHALGLGIQYALEGYTLQEVIWKLYTFWSLDLFEEDKKRNKSFFSVLHAIKTFYTLKDSILKGYKLVTYNGKPACELGFRILLPNGYVYRGFVDAVLQHETSGEVMVLEVKSTGSKYVVEAQYKNSSQAIGYSIILDHIFKDLSSYNVLYLPYLTVNMEFVPMLFTKSYLQRALWIQELLNDVETIEIYEKTQVYPMRGESCYKYYKPCKYYEICTLSNTFLTQELTEEKEKEFLKKENSLDKYPITVTIEDLIATQLTKTGDSQ